jgi:hypothetical protein
MVNNLQHVVLQGVRQVSFFVPQGILDLLFGELEFSALQGHLLGSFVSSILFKLRVLFTHFILEACNSFALFSRAVFLT